MIPSDRFPLVSLALCVLTLLIGVRPIHADNESKVDYLKDIKPLLRNKCISCHGALKQEGGLRLDSASLIQKGGDSGAAFVAGAAEESLLFKRVTDVDDNRMPPAEEGSPLTAVEVAKLAAWIQSGAVAPEEAIPKHPYRHWAFLPPRKAQAPSVSASWVRSDIDRFLAAEHQRVGVRAVGETSPSMLLRRASLALTGLPPTPAERQAFLADPSEAAFEKAVDRMLDSPRYGERWARHFMDILRYSDPSGYGKEIRDGRQHIWRWRDWIISSLNEDKGYDQMIVEMLAADEDSPEVKESLRATGFLARNWYKFNRNVWLDNIVEHSSKAFLGLTVNCARCHDHKYDPIEHNDYYRMRAIFETHDVRDDPFVSVSNAPEDMLVRTYDAHLNRETFPFHQGNEDLPDKSRPLSPGLPRYLGELSIEPVALPVTSWYPALRKENREAALKAAKQEVTATQSAIENARSALAKAKQQLAEVSESKHEGIKPTGPSSITTPTSATVLLSDDFSELDRDQWKVENGTWKAEDGRLIQKDGATKQYRLISAKDCPRDFRAKLWLRITGGETYKSVGFGFDGTDAAMNAVYLSVAGQKVQFTRQGSDGRWRYPAGGAASLAIKESQDYLLEVVVKDRLLNVLVDDELKVVYNLPKRKAGRMSIWTFSATAEFDQLDVSTLPPELQLTAAEKSATEPRPRTETDLQLALNVSEAALNAAIVKHLAAQSAVESLEARTIAELVKHGLASGDVDALADVARRTHRQHELSQLASQNAQVELVIEQSKQKQGAATDDARDKPTSELQAAEKKRATLQTKLESAKNQTDNDVAAYPVLGPQFPRTSSGRRLAFARWITDRKNPLAARVLVNHVWLRHFDAPLVERTFDFGLRSKATRHVELLDWLAVQLMDDGWSLKKLHKRIVMSGVYRLSSSSQGASSETRSIDPDNLTLWRMNARRMEAEVVRDSVLALGGDLDLTMGGPPVEHTRGQTVLRRSLYFRQDKERQMTFLSLFDGAKVNECYERKTTIAPQQALAMFNSRIASEQARRIAESYGKRKGDELVIALFEHVLCRKPTAQEQEECTQFLAEFQGNAAARQQLALVLLNHNDFVTIR